MSAATDTAREERVLLREEREVAKRYLGRVPWEMVAWGLGNLIVWLSLWPLVFTGVVPLWLGFILSTLCCSLSYLPSHEAQHSIIAAEGTKLRWLNELVGHVSTIPIVFPYRVGWITHRQHHAHANDTELDPDISSRADSWWRSALNSHRSRQPGATTGYAKVMQETSDTNAQRALLEAFVMRTIHFVILAVLAWSGYAIEGFLLWWLPRQIAYTYVQLVLSWAPHYPMLETGRYRDTRAWKSPFGTILTMGMEYHVIHHLYPKIPLIDTGKAFRDLAPLLAERGYRDDRSI